MLKRRHLGSPYTHEVSTPSVDANVFSLVSYFRLRMSPCHATDPHNRRLRGQGNTLASTLGVDTSTPIGNPSVDAKCRRPADDA